MTLLQAKKGFLYKVTDISGDKLLLRRLLDMGFTPDTEIFIAAIAPFGGTILIGMRGILVALREDAAQLVNIAPVTQQTSAAQAGIAQGSAGI